MSASSLFYDFSHATKHDALLLHFAVHSTQYTYMPTKQSSTLNTIEDIESAVVYTTGFSSTWYTINRYTAVVYMYEYTVPSGDEGLFRDVRPMRRCKMLLLRRATTPLRPNTHVYSVPKMVCMMRTPTSRCNLVGTSGGWGDTRSPPLPPPPFPCCLFSSSVHQHRSLWSSYQPPTPNLKSSLCPSV